MLSLSPFNLHCLGPSSPSGRHHCVGVCQVHFKSIFIGKACRLVLQPSFFLLITFEFILLIGLVLHTLVCAICCPRCANRFASTVLIPDILTPSAGTSFFEFTVDSTWAGFRADVFTRFTSLILLQVGVGMQITGRYFIWLSFTSITARFSRRRIWIHSGPDRLSLTLVSLIMAVVRCGLLLFWALGLWAQDLWNRSVGSCFLQSNDFLRKVVFWDVQIAVECHEYGAFNAIKLLQSEAGQWAQHGVQSFTIDLTETLVGEAVHDSTESLNSLRMDEQTLAEALLDQY